MSNMQLPHNHGQAVEQELENMPSTGDFQTAANIFKQLSDSSRIRIFWLLCHCEECVINLSAMVNMSSPGKEVYYKASSSMSAQLLHHMIEQMVAITCPAGSPYKGGPA